MTELPRVLLRCSRCRGYKPASDFAKDKLSSDGRYSQCRRCERDVRKAAKDGRA